MLTKKRRSGALLHKPVLLTETIANLNLQEGSVVVDGTLGSGGHSEAILKVIGSKGRLIALDQDPEALKRCQKKFDSNLNVSLYHSNFSEIPVVLDKLKIAYVNAVILDIGFSSDQLEDGSRGFSFEREGPLDMRMDTTQGLTASDLIRDLSQNELENLFFKYGEERFAKKYAKAIVDQRRSEKIVTTSQLVSVIKQVAPRSSGFKGGKKFNPATLVFQALRIEVNQELAVLEKAMTRTWPRIAKGGRFGIISFHSLEDRIVKNQFRKWYQDKEAERITKKPITAERKEILENRRARSAKLRIVEKI
jgi:16S rRNA (cytosine1402-N4)-methyltransferase